MYITLDRAKQHLNIESAFTGDDNYISFLIQVAEDTVSRHICTNLLDLTHEENVGGTTTLVLPASLQAAILLYIGDLYNSREGNAYGVSVSQVPFSYDYLLSLWKNYGDTTSDEFTDGVISEALKKGRFDMEGNLVVSDSEGSRFDDDGNLIVPDIVKSGMKERARQRIISGIHVDDSGNIVYGGN